MKALIDLFLRYGYWITFLFLFFENVLFIGLILPGDTVLLLAGFMASFGHFQLVYLMIIAQVASILGNMVGYLIGYRGGRPLIERLASRFNFLEGKLTQAEEYFDRYGPSTVFFGRFAAGVRVFISPLAGASKMSYPRFIAYTISAVIIWTSLVILLGFYFAENLDLLTKIVGGLGWGVLIILGLIFLAALFIKRARGGR
ncbi:MAG: DedA family protein [Actinomycetota bacterium]|nr:DedA family protein [Actinomycetota bacterium]